MNSDPRLMSSPLNNEEGSIGGNAFTGLGEERQPGDIAGITSMGSPGHTEQMGDGQASMEGPQGGKAMRIDKSWPDLILQPCW